MKAKLPSKGLASDKLHLILLVVVTQREPMLIRVWGGREAAGISSWWSELPASLQERLCLLIPLTKLDV